MKNRFQLLTFFVLIANWTYGQLGLVPDGTFAECPGEWIEYTVDNDYPDGCLYDWEVTNGEIQGGYQSNGKWLLTGGSLISIKWNNSTSVGIVKVTSTLCSNNNGNKTRSKNIPILSINGVTPSAITGPSTVAANVTTNKVYEVPQINFPNTGVGDPSPKQVSDYEWQLPTGWTIVSGGTSKKVTVKPDAFSEGDIRVRGKNTICQNGPFFTNWSPPKSVSRTVSTPGGITGNSGNSFVVCGETDPIAFQIPTVAGATSYTWTKPPNWSGTSTSNSITLTPNGTHAGTITVKVNSGPFTSQPSSRSLSIEVYNLNNPPALSGPSTVCISNSSFTLQNIPSGATVSWTRSSNLFPVSGQSSPTFTVRSISPTISGAGWVRATISGACGTVTLPRKDVWVGKPNDVLAPGDLSGPACMRLGTFDDFLGTPWPVTVPGADSYEPSIIIGGANNGITFYSEVNRVRVQVTVASNASMGIYTMQVAPKNVCGYGSAAYATFETTRRFYNCSGGGLLLTLSPNPADSEMTVNLAKVFANGKVEKADVLLYNNTNDLVFQTEVTEEKLDIPTNNLANGLYHLKVHYQNKVFQRHVIIKH